jgi:uncharacterized membrane protein
MARNLNIESEKIQTLEDRVSDAITAFAGSIKFVYAHIIWFGLWVLVNLGAFAFLGLKFDPYPFGLLTMVVSLEAIFLSTFVMISQNRQADREELRAKLDYETDVKAEEEISYIKAVVEEIAKEMNIEVKNGKVIKNQGERSQTP